jgi:hypothetical protein
MIKVLTRSVCTTLEKIALWDRPCQKALQGKGCTQNCLPDHATLCKELATLFHTNSCHRNSYMPRSLSELQSKADSETGIWSLSTASPSFMMSQTEVQEMAQSRPIGHVLHGVQCILRSPKKNTAMGLKNANFMPVQHVQVDRIASCT